MIIMIEMKRAYKNKINRSIFPESRKQSAPGSSGTQRRRIPRRVTELWWTHRYILRTQMDAQIVLRTFVDAWVNTQNCISGGRTG